MKVKASILKGKYLDSVKLMLISKELRSLNGIEDAVVIMATQENREILKSTNMLVPEIESAQETDIVAVVKADDQQSADEAIQKAENLVSSPTPKTEQDKGNRKALTIDKAILKLNGADLCLISVAGKYAAAEADKALNLGLHVMLFSDNVSLEDELALKTKAVEKGLLMMGPDCGTAIINGTPLAFANHIPHGKIGIVSASGTGLQETSATIANLGGGISQAFGTGGRDGMKEIGGLMLYGCLEYLINDPETEVIVLMGKTPAPDVLSKLWKLLSQTAKPVIINFLKPMEIPSQSNLQYTISLAETAQLACLATGIQTDPHQLTHNHPQPKLRAKYLRGLYSGGTLCAEGIQVYKAMFGHEPYSNVGSDENHKLEDGWNTLEDSLIDLGSDEFTVGRPHPMIDYSLRLQKIAQEAANRDVGIILLDVVLGYGAHPDPASELVPALEKLAKEIVVICHVLATEGDPQDREKQIGKLQQAGAIVFTSHNEAIEFACKCLKSARGI